MTSPFLVDPTVSGSPQALQALGAASPDLVADLRRSVWRARGALEAWHHSLGPARPRSDAGASLELVTDLAGVMEVADRWAGRVGRALADADVLDRPDVAVLAPLVLARPGPVPEVPDVGHHLLDVAVRLDDAALLTDDLLAGMSAQALADAARTTGISLRLRDLLTRAAVRAHLAETELPYPAADVHRDPRDQLRAVLGRDDVRLLSFVPRAGGFGDPELQFVVGDLEAADAVAVWVPGTGHDISTVEADLGIARDLLTGIAGVGRAGAVVVDLYDSPNTLVAAASPGFGQRHAPHLDELVDVVRHHAGDARVVAVGHSYGSFTAGQGALAGMDVDGLVLIGSPGVGAASVDQLGIPADEVWAARAPRDLIDVAADADEVFDVPAPLSSHVALGADPVDADFGARVFEVNPFDLDPRDPHYVDGHSEYLLVGSRSFDNVVRIVVGDCPSVPGSGTVDVRLDLADAPGPALVDRWTARRDPEWYVGSDATRAFP